MTDHELLVKIANDCRMFDERDSDADQEEEAKRLDDFINQIMREIEDHLS